MSMWRNNTLCSYCICFANAKIWQQIHKIEIVFKQLTLVASRKLLGGMFSAGLIHVDMDKVDWKLMTFFLNTSTRNVTRCTRPLFK